MKARHIVVLYGVSMSLLTYLTHSLVPIAGMCSGLLIYEITKVK